MSDWSQSPHNRKRVTAARPLAAVQRVPSLILRGRPSHIPPHLCRRARGNNDRRVPRRNLRKTRSSLMLSSLPTRTALWSSCDMPPRPLARLNQLSQLLQRRVLRNRRYRRLLDQNDLWLNSHFNFFSLFSWFPRLLIFFLHILLCTLEQYALRLLFSSIALPCNTTLSTSAAFAYIHLLLTHPELSVLRNG